MLKEGSLNSKFCGLLLALAALSACTIAPVKHGSKESKVARITFYNKHEDKWGNRIASSKIRRARRGYTCAAEQAFVFGTVVRIPWLARILGTGNYVVEDRGAAVEGRKASHGACPVFDLYVDSKKEMKQLASIVPPYLPYETDDTNRTN